MNRNVIQMCCVQVLLLFSFERGLIDLSLFIELESEKIQHLKGAENTTLEDMNEDVVFALEKGYLEKGKRYYKIDTEMNDNRFLQMALENYGATLTETNEMHIDAMIADISMTFYKEEHEPFIAIFEYHVDVVDAEQFVQSLVSDYLELVRQESYEMLINRAQEEGLILEAENRRDGKIALTFIVEE